MLKQQKYLAEINRIYNFIIIKRTKAGDSQLYNKRTAMPKILKVREAKTIIRKEESNARINADKLATTCNDMLSKQVSAKCCQKILRSKNRERIP